MKLTALGVAICALASAGCSRSCESLSAELEEKTADAVQAQAEAYSRDTTPEELLRQASEAGEDLQAIRSKMIEKNCPNPMGL